MNDLGQRMPDWDGDMAATVPIRAVAASVAFGRAMTLRREQDLERPRARAGPAKDGRPTLFGPDDDHANEEGR
jgi:hypothetical protein